MTLLETFEVTSGTTAGRRHRTSPILGDNQDAVGGFASPLAIFGAISDGCGSGRFSQFGSLLTVNTLTKLVRKAIAQGLDLHDPKALDLLYHLLVKYLLATAITLMDTDDDVPTDLLDLIEKDPVELAKVIRSLPGLNQVLNNYLIATAGGVLIGEETTTIFGGGDFFGIVNGETFIWEPESGNEPLYPILSVAFPGDDRFRFRVRSLPTADLNTFAFFTDGGKELYRVCGDEFECIPGTETPVGPISQIWTTDMFYTGNPHPDNPTTGPEELTTWLNRLSRNMRLPGPALHGGLLEDDTTLVAGRRKESVNT